MLGQSCAILVAGSKSQRGSSSRGRCLILLSLIDPGQQASDLVRVSFLKRTGSGSQSCGSTARPQPDNKSKPFRNKWMDSKPGWN